ncbi:ricin-type beta-trefoil lectin domain protein [Actinacidiphila glaucinigra]|uniref:ricin-type beta-trefoil lectin domain protein n=1 Tax=Actinacidiphila glaucinigra TaxID=235986 RepID=UPI0033B84B86
MGQTLDWNEENKVTSVTGFGDGAGPVVGFLGKCLDLSGGHDTEGNVIQLFSCNNSVGQQWKTAGDTLRAVGKCAAANGTAENAKILLATCNGSDAQKFVFRSADKSLYNPVSGKCVNVPDAAGTDSTDLVLSTCSGADTQKWAPADRVTYVYDAEGNRIIQHSAAGTTLYLGETELDADGNGNVIRATRSYTHAGATTVVRSATKGSATSHKLSVLLSDPLGTATASVDETAGQTVTRRLYKPYGETRGTLPTAWPNRRSYLGVGIDDTSTGLIHLGAREYDPSTGRFMSADPVVNLGDPLQMNGYSYSGNSPVTRSDPTGLCPADRCDGYGQNTGTSGGDTGGKDSGKPKTKSKNVVRNNGKSNVATACTAAKVAAMTDPHDIAVCATGVAAQEWAVKNKIKDAQVTVDIGTGGHKANDVPGGHSKEPGKDGIADVILWTKDRVYIWEVKPNPKAGASTEYAYVDGPKQLANYIEHLRVYLRSQGDKRSVLTGRFLERKTISWLGKPGNVWSSRAFPGMRFYGYKDDPTPSPTPAPGPSATGVPVIEPTATSTSEPTAMPSLTPVYNPNPTAQDYGLAAFAALIAYYVSSVGSKGPSCVLGGNC